MTDDRSTPNCLTCLHFERMYRLCRYDREASSQSPPRITHRTDLRTFRCEDYLGWEPEPLPFTMPKRPAKSTDADGADD